MSGFNVQLQLAGVLEWMSQQMAGCGGKTAVIGISGGLDSCLALLVAVRAMKQLGRPTTDVRAVTMPCFGTCLLYTSPSPRDTR